MSVLILGAGYVGSRCYELWTEQGKSIDATKRTVSPDSPFLVFDYLRDDLNLLPEADSLLLTFAPVNDDAYLYFIQACLAKYKRVFLYSTSSTYLQEYEGQIIDEATALDETHSRYKIEKKLQDLGVKIFVLAGIYGPNREPLTWLKKGLIKDLSKTVNLIHVDDIAHLSWKLMQMTELPERILFSSGIKHSWREMATTAQVDQPNNSLVKNIAPESILRTAQAKPRTSARKKSQFKDKLISNRHLCAIVGDYFFHNKPLEP